MSFKNFSTYITEGEQNKDFYSKDTTIHDLLPALQILDDQIDKLESKDSQWQAEISLIQKKFNELQSAVVKADAKLGIFIP
jgi:predicted  nucleic acid-binding Zn-ribbon protein